MIRNRNISRMIGTAVFGLLTVGSFGCGDENESSGAIVEEGTHEVIQSSLSRDTSPETSAENLLDLEAGNRAFAMDMYAQLAAGNEDNLFFSPFSLSTAFAMSYAGARNGTEDEMADVMHFTLAQEPLHSAFNRLDLELLSRTGDESEFQLTIANSLWTQVGFPIRPEYLDVLAVNYGAAVRAVDFTGDPEGAIGAVNDWVALKTEDKIPQILDPTAGAENVMAMIVNAIYFKAAWDNPFEPAATANESFETLEGESVSVPMMSQGDHYGYGEGDGYQVVSIPYDGDAMDMVAIVPDLGTFPTFEAALDGDRVAEILDSMAGYYWVSLTMPKFAVTSKFGLEDDLQTMGMVQAFDPVLADFSGMTDEKIHISKVIHEATITVDEAGTEAAAATVIIDSNGDAEYVEVKLNRPFIFLIRDRESGVILFVGRVTQPDQ